MSVRPGVFAFPKHDLNLQLSKIERMQPSAIKAFVHLTSDDWWKSVYERAPNMYGVVVDGNRSDYPGFATPAADIEAAARELDLRPHAPRRVMGKNERLLCTDPPSKWNEWIAYHVAFTRRAHELGISVALGALNTGHPYIGVFGDPVDQWQWLAPVEAEMQTGDCWDLHSYWNASGPLECWPWTAGRFLRCPTSYDILIGECGFDQAVMTDAPNGGWLGRVGEDAYITQLLDYHRLIEDPRVVGTCIFLLDYDDPHWASWDITSLVDRMVGQYGVLDVPGPAQLPKRIGRPVDWLRITADYKYHKATNPLGGWGMDFSCYTGTQVRSAADGVVHRVENDGDSGYGRWVEVNHWWGFTRYAHLSAAHVLKGQYVGAGSVIGLSGNTGNSTGPHLHFEVISFYNHIWPYRVDPAPLLGIGDPVDPTPPPQPDPSPEISEQEKAAARARISDANFLDKAATYLGYKWLGLEWEADGFVYATVQKAGTKQFYILRGLAGHYDEDDYDKVEAELL